MQYPVRHLLIVFTLATLTGLAHAIYPPPVEDGGKFFKEETITKANAKIRAIYQNYRKDVVVETYPSIPPEIEKKFKDAERKDLFSAWGRERAEKLGVNGVLLLFCKKPGYLQIEVDAETRRKAFPAADRDKLRTKMLSELKERDHDGALLLGLEVIESALKANLK